MSFKKRGHKGPLKRYQVVSGSHIRLMTSSEASSFHAEVDRIKADIGLRPMTPESHPFYFMVKADVPPRSER